MQTIIVVLVLCLLQHVQSKASLFGMSLSMGEQYFTAQHPPQCIIDDLQVGFQDYLRMAGNKIIAFDSGSYLVLKLLERVTENFKSDSVFTSEKVVSFYGAFAKKLEFRMTRIRVEGVPNGTLEPVQVPGPQTVILKGHMRNVVVRMRLQVVEHLVYNEEDQANNWWFRVKSIIHYLINQAKGWLFGPPHAASDGFQRPDFKEENITILSDHAIEVKIDDFHLSASMRLQIRKANPAYRLGNLLLALSQGITGYGSPIKTMMKRFVGLDILSSSLDIPSFEFRVIKSKSYKILPMGTLFTILGNFMNHGGMFHHDAVVKFRTAWLATLKYIAKTASQHFDTGCIVPRNQ